MLIPDPGAKQVCVLNASGLNLDKTAASEPDTSVKGMMMPHTMTCCF